jgi:hypothetical protein
MFPILSLLAALIPTLNYGVTRVIDKYTGGAKPSNAQEELTLKQADVAQLEALAKLDDASGASQWVVNIRALQRPFAITVILGIWGTYVFKNGMSPDDIMNLASAAVFYLFGERTRMYIAKAK